jgi:hypothetical protein
MDIEFHYYMTHLIALRAGFRPVDAFTIACASQYTDDNDRPYRIEGGEAPCENLISQTEDITKPQEERLSIYPIFHFCPGTKAEVFKLSPSRRDGKFHLLATIPDNRNARKIFNAALKAGDLYRIGIGTHMYADTFCHRDFVGWKDEFNWTRLGGFIEGLWSALGPAIGHALAMHAPDIPALIWEDIRLTSPFRQKKNKEQILAAAGNIFDFYCKNTKPGKSAAAGRKKLLGDLDAAMGAEAEADSAARVEARKANYKDLLRGDYKEYRETRWFDAAVDRRIIGETVGTPNVQYKYFWKGDYRQSDWFQFQEAVKAHQTVAFKVLASTFAAMEIDIAKASR